MGADLSSRGTRSEVPPDGVSTLRSYLDALWRRKWVALAPLLVIPLATLVATLRQPELYEASADVLVNRQEAATTSLIGQTPALDDAERTMATQAALARVPLVLDRTIAAVGPTGLSRDALLRSSSVFPLADLLRFTVSAREPARAAQLANVYAREFVRYRRELDTVGLAHALEGLKARIAELEAAGEAGSPLHVRLADREQQLESLEALRNSNVAVVRAAGPGDAERVAPRPRRNTAVALASGMVLGLILVFLWESLSTRPRSDDELEALLGMPLLARIRLAARGEGAAPLGSSGPEADAVHTLRTKLELANLTAAARTIMVTSPCAGEGKSAVSARLAVALARAGRRVVLVDLDLRESTLTRLLGLDHRAGVTAVARGECELADALVAIPLEDGVERTVPADSNGRGDVRGLLEVVSSGRTAVHPAELLSSKALAAILAELEERADVVLVEVPPLLEAPDAAAVGPRLDGLLLVVRSRRARGPTLAHARRAVETWPVAKLGFVVVEGGDEWPHTLGLRRIGVPARAKLDQPERVA
jgi:Mrp family chromosome partitioning ATPase